MDQRVARKPDWLLDHADNVFTQTGEDGIVAKILETLPSTDGWCVEFGAWDGIHYSNTRNLILSKEYSAVLIEGDAAKAVELAQNYKDYPRVHPINTLVGFTKGDTLDTILQDTDIPADFDFLSIDVDGNDYHIWMAMETYTPKVVCIEYNLTIGNGVRFVQEASPSVMQGASPTSIVELGKEKGYELVCVTDLNLIFVRSEYFDCFGIEDNSLETLRSNEDLVTHIFCGYDGRVLLAGHKQIPWHRMEIKPSRVQQLPRGLFGFPDNYSRFQRVWHKAFRSLRKRLPFL